MAEGRSGGTVRREEEGGGRRGGEVRGRRGAREGEGEGGREDVVYARCSMDAPILGCSVALGCSPASAVRAVACVRTAHVQPH